MKYEIKHSVMQSLEVTLEPGESLFSESGPMAWMSSTVEMTTTGKGGGLGGMLGRALAGESLLFTNYKSTAPNSKITFVTRAPGKIVALELAAGQEIIAQRGTFMAAEQTVTVKIAFTKKLGAGFFGGEGFILQKLTGPGVVFAEVSGEVEMITLMPGEKLKIDPGHLAMMDASISYDIEMIKGVTNIFFAGEGLFIANATGPGRVWLQTMPISLLANAIKQFIPTKS
jgi:uncharacterized protein (TIGR00266 family)